MDPTLESAAEVRRDLDAFRPSEMAAREPAEFAKTAGIIERLLERAEQTINRQLPPGRFPWVHDGYTEPDAMVAQARGYLTAMTEDGRWPLWGRFAEPGMTTIDHALFHKDGLHHLFYILGKACTHWPEYPTRTFGHAVSDDLIRWRVGSPVLPSPETGWDEYQVWAPHVIEHGDRYWMAYTGVNEACSQAIGMAHSQDLETWTRIEGNPCITPGPWGIWQANGPADCRDPIVIEHEGRFYCYYTAVRRVEGGDPPHASCIGVASSTDLIAWRDEGFIPVAQTSTPPESPFVVQREGRFYLFYTEYGSGTVYAVSDDPVRGWTDPPADRRVVLGGVSASEVYHHDGTWYLSLISHDLNQLHFFEIRELIWGDDGRFTTRAIQ